MYQQLDPTNIHVLEFSPSYNVRNGAEKAVTVLALNGFYTTHIDRMTVGNSSPVWSL